MLKLLTLIAVVISVGANIRNIGYKKKYQTAFLSHQESFVLRKKSFSIENVDVQRKKRSLHRCLVNVTKPGILFFVGCHRRFVCTPSEQPCPQWSSWSGQEFCSVSCGGGYRTELRYCMYRGLLRNCVGNRTRRVRCNEQTCPSWTSWSTYSHCSKTCGTGQQVMARSCLLGEINTDGCEGPKYEVVPCVNSSQCDPQWSTWSNFTACSTSCGGIGEKRRTRRCMNANNNNSACNGSTHETFPCWGEISKSSCQTLFSQWSHWSECRPPPGYWTVAQRNRSCFTQDCRPEFLVDFKICRSNVFEDSTNRTSLSNVNRAKAIMLSWSSWTACSVFRNSNELQYRARNCSVTSINKTICKLVNTETRRCQNSLRTSWETWKPWSRCISESCQYEQGYRIRQRRCYKMYSGRTAASSLKTFVLDNETELNPEFCNGSYNASYQKVNCVANLCSVFWDNWSSWTQCSSTCGSGFTVSRRQCLTQSNEARCVGASVKYKNCYSPPCWTNWSVYGPCTTSCGMFGMRQRFRRCQGITSLDTKCEGSPMEVQRCNTRDCPLWGLWSSFTSCSATCGIGRKSRTRICLRGTCEGKNVLTRSCSERICPQWSKWSLYSCCSTSCGPGLKTRSRNCDNPIPGIAECEGEALEQVSCDVGSCNVSRTAHNSFTCGNVTESGVMKRLIQPRIHSGKTTSIRKWPWQVSFQENRCRGLGRFCWFHFCGGTLIAPQWVVSAAHCTQENESFTHISYDQPGNDVSVLLGVSHLNSEGEGRRVNIRRIIVHTNYTYNGGTVRNDIVLLQLNEPVELSQLITPACLYEPATPSDGTICYATGWGRTEISSQITNNLREAALPVLEFEKCRNLSSNYRLLDERYHLCAGNATVGGPDTCRGDSGGPLVCRNENNLWYLTGVTSFGFSSCGSRNHVGIYTSVYNYLSWIRSTIEQHSFGGC